eukprot:2442947-Pyramimonas_sp.AAC.1
MDAIVSPAWVRLASALRVSSELCGLLLDCPEERQIWIGLGCPCILFNLLFCILQGQVEYTNDWALWTMSPVLTWHARERLCSSTSGSSRIELATHYPAWNARRRGGVFESE